MHTLVGHKLSDYQKQIAITLVVGIIGAVVGASVGYYLLESSTDTELKLAHVNYENEYHLFNDNKTESLRLMPIITVYNSKRSDYPARLFPAKNQIINCENLHILNEAPSGLNEAIVPSGEAVVIYSGIDMLLNKTGSYTLQTTVHYLDVKTGEMETIEFYKDFEIIPNGNHDKDLYPYKIWSGERDVYNKPWKIGNKFGLLNENQLNPRTQWENTIYKKGQQAS